MKDIRIAYTIAALTILLILGNIWHAYPQDFDVGFWLRCLANVLILASMLTSIRYNRKQKSD